MQEFLQQLINGLSVGSIYALIAVGYTMVYGVLQLINFAHGDVFMVGALVSLFAATGRLPKWMPWWVHVAVVAVLAAAALVMLARGRKSRDVGLALLPYAATYAAPVAGRWATGA